MLCYRKKEEKKKERKAKNVCITKAGPNLGASNQEHNLMIEFIKREKCHFACGGCAMS